MIRVATLVVLLTVALPPIAAQAAPTATVNGVTAEIAMTPSVIEPVTRRVTATLTLANSRSNPIAMDVSTITPQFSRFVRGRPFKEGHTLHFVRIRSIRGRYRWLSRGEGGGGISFICGQYTSNAHGVENSSGHVGLVMPANGRIVITYEFDVSPDTPWIGTSYAPGVRLSPVSRRPYEPGSRPSIPRSMRTLSRAKRVVATEPLYLGPVAARFDLNSVPAPIGENRIVQRLGKPVTIVGQLVPALPNKVIDLPYRLLRLSPKGWGEPLVDGSLGQSITDAEGKFRIDAWIPPAEGLYTISPTYARQDGDLEPDSSCLDVAVFDPKRRDR